MNYFPIEDNNSNFDLVEIKTTHEKVKATPHCKIHGSMNCVANLPEYNRGENYRNGDLSVGLYKDELI